MKKYYYSDLDDFAIKRLCQRGAVDFSVIYPLVSKILAEVKQSGDVALVKFTQEYDGYLSNEISVTELEVTHACFRVSEVIKKSCEIAAGNIKRFHRQQIKEDLIVETMPGVICQQKIRAIEKVGFYIPGGSAPLLSAVLMLAIPAQLAGCQQIILCTPPEKNGKIADAILYVANLCGIKQIFKVGGAQAIGAMAYGTETIPKVDKIFGPGNVYVTAAKLLVSIDPDGAVIDMPAGPSEVLVIADGEANPRFVASDLLAQAEHDPRSQVVLISSDENKINAVLDELQKQLTTLPRRTIAEQALQNSFALVVDEMSQAFRFSNDYAPEHLILNLRAPNDYLDKIDNAGTVFIGAYSCESAGDYASGSNHTLPTSGYARAMSGLTLESFIKKISFQTVSKQGIKNLVSAVACMAETEGLDGHKRAIEIRYEAIKADADK